MLIYLDGGAVQAVYEDGLGHLIHYTSAQIVPGKSVTFDSVAGAGPTFRLSYSLDAPSSLTISFGMVPPGQTALTPIATGTATRVGSRR